MLNFRRYHEKAKTWSQRRWQRWYSHIPSCLYLVWGKNNYLVCIHSCKLNICCKSWSDKVFSIQCYCWVVNRYWCYRRVKISWKLLILALSSIWICTTVNWVIEWNSYFLWWYIFSISLTDHLTILSDIYLLTYCWSVLVNKLKSLCASSDSLNVCHNDWACNRSIVWSYWY